MKASFSNAWHLFVEDCKRYYLAFIIAILAWACFSIFLGTPCSFVLLFGIPCPLCGVTRALWYCLQLRFADAFCIQPLWPLVPVGLVLFVLSRYFKKFKGLYVIIYCCVALFAFLVFYAFRMATQFPGDPPMVYTDHNLLMFLLKLLYKQ